MPRKQNVSGNLGDCHRDDELTLASCGTKRAGIRPGPSIGDENRTRLKTKTGL